MSNVDLRMYDPTKVRGLFDELRERLDEATAENRRLREVLQYLNRKGGLGLDVHARIDAALASQSEKRL